MFKILLFIKLFAFAKGICIDTPNWLNQGVIGESCVEYETNGWC